MSDNIIITMLEKLKSLNGDGETNNTSKVVSDGIDMTPPKKRIYNPDLGMYFAIRQRTTDSGKKGQIKGRWSSKKN